LDPHIQQPRNLVAGDIVSRYELLCPIASGGMGVVWMGRIRGSFGFERLVAIKMIRPERGEDESFRRMFLDEARIVSRIHHPNVVEILDVGEDDGDVFMVMELVDGTSFSRLVRALRSTGAALPVPILLRIYADVADALEVIHTLAGEDGEPLRVVHRDLTPDNILVTRFGGVKIIDFGVARARGRVSAETTPGILKGKVRYVSPEQLRGEEVDGRTDLWALGVALFHQLTGKFPYDGEGEFGVMRAVLMGGKRPSLPEGTPESVKVIVDRLLAYDRDARIGSAKELRSLCEEALHGLGGCSQTVVADTFRPFFAEQDTARRKLIEDAEKLVRARALIAGTDDHVVAPALAPVAVEPDTLVDGIAEPRWRPMAWVVLGMSITALAVGGVVLGRSWTGASSPPTSPSTMTSAAPLVVPPASVAASASAVNLVAPATTPLPTRPSRPASTGRPTPKPAPTNSAEKWLFQR
jgi:serine/threonine-protein kinase